MLHALRSPRVSLLWNCAFLLCRLLAEMAWALLVENDRAALNNDSFYPWTNFLSQFVIERVPGFIVTDYVSNIHLRMLVPENTHA
jgi:hypothetical protein